jgi:hypothetical protein
VGGTRGAQLSNGPGPCANAHKAAYTTAAAAAAAAALATAANMRPQRSPQPRPEHKAGTHCQSRCQSGSWTEFHSASQVAQLQRISYEFIHCSRCTAQRHTLSAGCAPQPRCMERNLQHTEMLLRLLTAVAAAAAGWQQQRQQAAMQQPQQHVRYPSPPYDATTAEGPGGPPVQRCHSGRSRSPILVQAADGRARAAVSNKRYKKKHVTPSHPVAGHMHIIVILAIVSSQAAQPAPKELHDTRGGRALCRTAPQPRQAVGRHDCATPGPTKERVPARAVRGKRCPPGLAVCTAHAVRERL